MSKKKEQPKSGGWSRRAWIGVALGGAAVALLGERWWRKSNPRVVTAGSNPITVYASPTCGCCTKWVDHLKENGFLVTVESLVDVTPIKRQFAVPESLWSCHTAMVHAYIMEGHVPADLIQRVIRERPAIAGLAVPGMPNGSPGMEGSTKDPYDVMAFAANGAIHIFASR